MIHYPNSPFRIGDILEDCYKKAEKECWENQRTAAYHYLEVNACPEIFKEIFWWEDRKEDEMPEYVKVNTEKTSLFFGQIHRVREIGTFEYPKEVMNSDASQWYFRLEGKADEYRFNLSHFLPATQSEYDNQTKNK